MAIDVAALLTALAAQTTTAGGSTVLINTIVSALRGYDPAQVEGTLDLLQKNTAALVAAIPVA